MLKIHPIGVRFVSKCSTSGFLKTLNAYTWPIDRWTASAAGGIPPPVIALTPDQGGSPEWRFALRRLGARELPSCRERRAAARIHRGVGHVQ